MWPATLLISYTWPTLTWRRFIDWNASRVASTTPITFTSLPSDSSYSSLLVDPGKCGHNVLHLGHIAAALVHVVRLIGVLLLLFVADVEIQTDNDDTRLE